VYLSPLSQPVLLLPLWVGETLRDDVLVDLLGSALAGYLHVRVQDDRFDEGRSDPETALVLGSALLVRHHALLAPRVSDSGYWNLHSRRWQAYADAMLLERRLAAGEGAYDEAAFDRVLDRTRPLLLPGAAALALSGRWADLPALERLVDAVSRAHQRFDDLTDASDDLARGRRTLLLATALGDAARDPVALPRLAGWLVRGGIDATITAARADLALARTAAEALDAPEALAWIVDREAAMDEGRRRFYARLFGSMFGTDR
jgi:hypothetical protein